MRRRRQKLLININPRNKKWIDRAEVLIDSNTGTAELAELASKLHLPELTKDIVDDFQASWEKQNVKSESVFVRKVMLDVCGMEMPFYVATVDGITFETFEVSSDELEQCFAESSVRQLGIAPERKRSDCQFRGVNFRAWRIEFANNHPQTDKLNSLTVEQVEKLVG